jgi:ArsR family metal-binding transcriptional regulator
MLIPTYELDVFTPPCDPGAERFSAVAFLPGDISEALPYLNATLRGAVYTESAHTLTWKKAGHNVAFHADRIAVSNVEDRQAATEELDGLVKLVNRTWECRDEIAPDHATRQRPTAMAIYKLLPGTNCKQCGQPTCWNFALKLVASQVALAVCPPLSEPTYAGRRADLEALLVPMPAIGTRDDTLGNG